MEPSEYVFGYGTSLVAPCRDDAFERETRDDALNVVLDGRLRIIRIVSRDFVLSRPRISYQALSCDGISDSQCSAGGAPLILITCAIIERKICNLLVKHNRPYSPQNFRA